MTSTDQSSPPIVLCIGGHDPSGGAGLQADIEAAAACGGIAQSLPTCLTVQNRSNARQVQPVEPALFNDMLDCLQQQGQAPAAVKFGLIASEGIIDILAGWLNLLPSEVPVVLDPVLKATGGSALNSDRVARALHDRLLPRATVLTPNQQELQALSGEQDIDAGAGRLLDNGAQYVLVTGGDAEEAEVVNRLYAADFHRAWHWPRLPYGCHGSGCTLASALATFLAHGADVPSACEAAQRYTQQTLARAINQGEGPRLPRRITPSA